jgi:hypothetical protein
VLVITVAVFVFIVFATLDGGRVTTLLLASARHPCIYPLACVNCESTSSAMVVTSGNIRLRSRAFRFFCKIPKPGHLKHSQSCTSIPGE